MAFAIKSLRPEVKVYGVQAAGAPSMEHAFHDHKYETLDHVDTFADGIAVKTPGETTYEMVSQYVDDVVTVSEDEIASAIEADETFRSICDEPDNPADSLKYGQKTVDRLFSVTKYVRYLGVALVLLLVFIALVFINNTIRLAIMARRKEIAIMRLVGASNGFIRGPFLMEGALHALIGSLLAVGVLQVLRMYGIPKLQSALSFLSLDVSGNTYIMIYIVLVVAGLVIGLLGSAFAMRRYLKV